MSHITSNPTLDPSNRVLDPALGHHTEPNTNNPQLEDTPSEYETLELWASQWDISDLDLPSPPRNENEPRSSLVPPPAPSNARARKGAAAKKRRHNGVKDENCDEWFEYRYDADHVVNWGR